jgi:hypothetical protein
VGVRVAHACIVANETDARSVTEIRHVSDTRAGSSRARFAGKVTIS